MQKEIIPFTYLLILGGAAPRQCAPALGLPILRME